jgi:CPA2 family monovalent cation:H+ antiporter-2
MLLNTATVMSNYYYVGMIVLIIISVKILTGSLASVHLGMPARVCIFTGFALCQIGEISFVLAKTGFETTLIPDGVSTRCSLRGRSLPWP